MGADVEPGREPRVGHVGVDGVGEWSRAWMLIFSTLPFALAAAFFPAGLAAMTWLLSVPPALQRGTTYLAGAAVSTVAGGVTIVVLLRGVGGSAEHPGVVGAFEMGVGVLLLILAVGFAIGKPTVDTTITADRRSGRLRRGRRVGIFLLGVVMWTPSFAYLAALQLIADAQLSMTGVALNLAIVDVVILSFVELPLVVYAVSPARAAKILYTLRAWLVALGWRPAAAIVAVGGIYLLARGGHRVS
jgi:hypothetical protein